MTGGGKEDIAGGEGGGWLAAAAEGRSSLSPSDSLGSSGTDLTSSICETQLKSSVKMRDAPARTDSVGRPRLGTGIARFIRGSIGCAGGGKIVLLQRGNGVGAFLGLPLPRPRPRPLPFAGLTGSLAARSAPLPATGPPDWPVTSGAPSCVGGLGRIGLRLKTWRRGSRSPRFADSGGRL